jgi:hypothetical protein
MNSTAETAELVVQALSPKELAAFRRWFAQFDARNWDEQIEADAAAGKLDAFAAQALAEHQAGKNRPL